MEVCAGFELIVIENATALGHDVLELSKRREVLVGEWLIQNGPEVFGGLQFGRVRGQGPLRDTVVQRWRDPIDGTICYLFIPINAPHSPPNETGYVQYGPNTIGSGGWVGPAGKAPPAAQAAAPGGGGRAAPKAAAPAVRARSAPAEKPPA